MLLHILVAVSTPLLLRIPIGRQASLPSPPFSGALVVSRVEGWPLPPWQRIDQPVDGKTPKISGGGSGSQPLNFHDYWEVFLI